MASGVKRASGTASTFSRQTARIDVRRSRLRDEFGRLLLRPDQPHIGSKLDDELEERICGYIAQGMTLTDSCGLCDVDRVTIGRWKERGLDEPESRYGLFLDRCQKAELSCKKVWIARIAGDLDWRALAFLLKARWPESFAEYVRQELSGPGGIPLPAGNPFQVNVNVSTSGAPEQFTVIDHSGDSDSHKPSERLPEPEGQRTATR